jgi:hypothetical protein
MGLWNLRDDGTGVLERQPTPLVDAYRALVAGGSMAVGRAVDPSESAVRGPSGEGFVRSGAVYTPAASIPRGQPAPP